MSKAMPREDGFDHTLSLMREGYLYILNRRRSFQSDVFETRLLGKKVICMGGKDAAEIFYDTDKFKRKGAAPNRVIQTLFGKNGVQALDGQAHQHRKEMFMSIMSKENLLRLTQITKQQWDQAIKKWEQMDQVVFYEEVQKLLCRTACEWAGVPVTENKIDELANDLEALFESPAAVGPDHWRGRSARNQVEQWLGELVESVRRGDVHPSENTALHRFSFYRDLDGQWLDTQTAAVEVINILRPIVAIAVFINFAMLAVLQFPEEKKKLEMGDDRYTQMFVQEVRRFYPFFPFVGALVKNDFTWNGYHFEKGTLTFLDLYGTNHDPNYWENPDVFHPERFAKWEGSLFDFIPQGGGDYVMGHRCAGEWVTIEVMKVSLDVIVNQMTFNVPEQDLSYSLVSIPSIPRSKIIIKDVKRKNKTSSM